MHRHEYTNIEVLKFADGVSRSTASLFNFYTNATFELNDFGQSAQGGSWTSNVSHLRTLADVNGDGRADIVGFGNAGVFVSLATGGGHFAASSLRLGAFGVAAGGWNDNNIYLRQMVDVNGDGRADIVGFASSGVQVSLATASGSFGAVTQELAAFGADTGGWNNNNVNLREMADVNGDGMADIVGFGSAGALVSLATGGGHFGGMRLALATFGSGPEGGGWNNNNLFKRMLADVNGDGMADIVGFSSANVQVALATGGGHFGAVRSDIAYFGSASGGWSSDSLFPRDMGDVNGDGRADIVGFGSLGVQVSLAGQPFI